MNADRLGYLDGIREGAVHGWAVDKADPTQVLRIELMVDGIGLGTAIAEQERPDLAGVGEGARGFVCPIPKLLPVSRRSVLRARFAGTDMALERSGEVVSQLVADGSIAFEEDHTPWDVLARHDPSWAWRRAAAAGASMEAERGFLRGGAETVRAHLAVLSRLYGPFPSRELALDVGCGSGRLTIPLARRFDRVIAYDLSRRMLAYAAGHCVQQGVGNVLFCYAPDSLFEHIAPGLDLVVALGVFELMAEKEGIALLERVLAAMREGARGCIGFLGSGSGPGSHALDLGADGTVVVPANVYDMNRVGAMLAQAGVRDMQVAFEQGDDRVDWVVYFRKGRR